MTYKPGGDTVTRHGRTSQYMVEGFSQTQTMHLDTSSVDTETAFMLVDISDTTNWKHTNTDCVIQIDPDSTFLGVVKIGFLSSVDATNGDFHQILDVQLAKKSDLIIKNLTFEGGFHCQADTHFGPISANSTLFQTDVNLQGPDGATSYPSGNNDLVLIVGRSAGTVNVSVTIIYETVA